MNNQTLAINSIMEYGDVNGWDHGTQLIVTCDFISQNNLDEGFRDYLRKRSEEERK